MRAGKIIPRMRRYMVHLLNSTHLPKDATELLNRARSLGEQDGLVVRDARISTKYIEYDISIPDEANEKAVISHLESISPLASFEEVVERHIAKEEAIKLAIQSFNDEKYWNAHELLEGVWKSSKGMEKNVLNGIILVAAAFVHDEKDETGICISILKRALKKLEAAKETYSGIDVDRLAGKILEIINSGVVTRFTI
ncbi:MAG TPA: DUF309 domain-containing protein [Nitrososphaera sp.]|nr:DUF309 domain-containing protein [Nitrososphaera sp.]